MPGAVFPAPTATVAPMSAVLVTGGAGYIGSHCCVALGEAGHDVVVVDSLVNSSARVVDEVAALVATEVRFHEGDIRDRRVLDAALRGGDVVGVVHLAGLKAVGESVRDPSRYWDDNVGGSIALLRALADHGVTRLVFSSSATVYEEPPTQPVTEDAPLGPTNPYGHTKAAIERMLADVAASDDRWRVACLRYFNPIGAHPSARIGEEPRGEPNNLMPYVMQVAAGLRPELAVFGRDYPTPDGTAIRDYIHVVDLAEAHVAALDRLDTLPGWRAFNLGTGHGASVLDVVAAAERAVGRTIPRVDASRRPGDVTELVADPSRAQAELGWRATRDLDAMCADQWRFQSGRTGV